MSDSKKQSLLSATRVHEIFQDCLYRDGEDTSGHVAVEGITMNVGFHPERLASYEDEIVSMLGELPDVFHASKGGGMTFLNACDDRHGRRWTDQHHTMELLFLLGLGLKKASICAPREMWRLMPGGVPYMSVDV